MVPKSIKIFAQKTIVEGAEKTEDTNKEEEKKDEEMIKEKLEPSKYEKQIMIVKGDTMYLGQKKKDQDLKLLCFHKLKFIE